MKLLIPSAKELNEQARIVEPQPLSENTKTILQALKAFSLEELATFYGISEERALIEKERIEAINTLNRLYENLAKKKKE